MGVPAPTCVSVLFCSGLSTGVTFRGRSYPTSMVSRGAPAGATGMRPYTATYPHLGAISGFVADLEPVAAAG